MRKIISAAILFVFVLAMAVSVSAAGSADRYLVEEEPVELTAEESEYIDRAIDFLIDCWKAEYDTDNMSVTSGNEKNDGYLKIINTRYVGIKDDVPEDSILYEYFKDLAAVVEFEIYTDYFRSAPYYVNPGVNNNVLFYKDGSAELGSRYFDRVRARTYTTDYSDVIDVIKDCSAMFNNVYNLQPDAGSSLVDGLLKGLLDGLFGNTEPENPDKE